MKKFVTVETREENIANDARRGIFNLIVDYLISIMGEDAVSRVGCSEISIGVGETSRHGRRQEICVNIAPVVKDWKGDPEVNRDPYDRQEEADAFKQSEIYRLKSKIETKERHIEKMKKEIEELERLKEELKKID